MLYNNLLVSSSDSVKNGLDTFNYECYRIHKELIGEFSTKETGGIFRCILLLYKPW